jgi:hypothetical protein
MWIILELIHWVLDRLKDKKFYKSNFIIIQLQAQLMNNPDKYAIYLVNTNN